VKAQYGEEGLLVVLKQIHARMHYSDRFTRERFNYILHALEPQIKHFTDTHLISLVGTAMDARYGTERFNNLINWGNSYYASGTDTYTNYQTMLQSVYEANGNPLGVKLTCLEALMEASQDEQVAAFTEMSALYANLFHQGEEYPILSTDPAPYDYPLVSAEGMVTLSSYPELYTAGDGDDLHESALAYCHAKRLIDDSAAGAYSAWTQDQYEDPWMVVQLKGDSEIYGIIIQNAEGSVPLTVEISPDAKTWTTLIAGRVVSEGQTINIPADGSAISKYVRVRYSNTTGGMVRLKLNKIQVYAKKRY
ncbi:MAG: discoidin domain-containing protein, partial [Kiritimatiellae bacterium]|nr:discoidin domain-containing protein [Kiritimatiellia bacterium]